MAKMRAKAKAKANQQKPTHQQKFQQNQHPPTEIPTKPTHPNHSHFGSRQKKRLYHLRLPYFGLGHHNRFIVSMPQKSSKRRSSKKKLSPRGLDVSASEDPAQAQLPNSLGACGTLALRFLDFAGLMAVSQCSPAQLRAVESWVQTIYENYVQHRYDHRYPHASATQARVWWYTILCKPMLVWGAPSRSHEHLYTTDCDLRWCPLQHSQQQQ